MIEPTYFKTNPGEHATVSHEEIPAYHTFRQKLAVYTNNEITNAPEHGAVLDTVLKIINEKSPGSIIQLEKEHRCF